MNKLCFKKWTYGENSGIGGVTFNRDEDKSFKIYFMGNLDLYFSFNYSDELEDDLTFLIGKDNYQVWSIFDRLYQKLITGNLYSFKEEDKDRIITWAEVFNEDYHAKLKEKEDMIDSLNHNLKCREEYKSLVNDGVITWSSDEYSVDFAPFFKIEKVGVSYLISFGFPEIKRKLDSEERMLVDDFKYLKVFNVRLRNSGSRYEPCNMVFMEAFNALMDLEDMEQIHIEEYLIDKELEKGISLERILRK